MKLQKSVLDFSAVPYFLPLLALKQNTAFASVVTERWNGKTALGR